MLAGTETLIAQPACRLGRGKIVVSAGLGGSLVVAVLVWENDLVLSSRWCPALLNLDRWTVRAAQVEVN